MAARRELVSTGDVTIVINDDPAKALRTPAGGTLLGTLAANQDLHPVGLRREGDLRRLHGDGHRRRRCDAADRARPHLPRRGA